MSFLWVFFWGGGSCAHQRSMAEAGRPVVADLDFRGAVVLVYTDSSFLKPSAPDERGSLPVLKSSLIRTLEDRFGPNSLDSPPLFTGFEAFLEKIKRI